MNRIESLHEHGQSIWFDYIDRTLLQSGALADLVDAGVRGVTSNPTIFQQAISSSDTYDDDLQQIARTTDDPEAIFEHLAIADIQAAADILRPVFDNANGHDGFVSLEVSPKLAYDHDNTVAEALRLRDAVDRPNLMIKVPATGEGVPAIQLLIAEGLNINVTLIFAIQRYLEVMEAFMAGLEQRLSNGSPIDHCASVASFFVSRVDSNVDGKLDKVMSEDSAMADMAQSLKGKVAVANAKLAYREFQRVFAGDRWSKLEDNGAVAQRPLWASTSTKNPEYQELLYVETLVGPHTVNTMPPDTLDAFRDHGVVEDTVTRDVDQAQDVLNKLESLGISLAEVTNELEEEGVQKFAASYDELLDTILEQREQMTK